MRGRVMALYSIVFLGSTPIGAPLVGWLADAAGPRAGLVAGAAAALLAASPPGCVRAGGESSRCRPPVARRGAPPRARPRSWRRVASAARPRLR